ncbi:MAG TPA: hypothetical protein QGI71_01050 [Dehalococcoidia bacterium]|jgi:hypothetical protein|nr:hypothetical protein [Dehalococcoidia bacterium]
MTSQDAEGAEGPLIRTFDEFIEAAAAHFSYNERESPFPSREAGMQGLRRWWGEQVELEVVGLGSYRWHCPGCSNVVESQGDDVHTWGRTTTCCGSTVRHAAES